MIFIGQCINRLPKTNVIFRSFESSLKTKCPLSFSVVNAMNFPSFPIIQNIYFFPVSSYLLWHTMTPSFSLFRLLWNIKRSLVSFHFTITWIMLRRLPSYVVNSRIDSIPSIIPLYYRVCPSNNHFLLGVCREFEMGHLQIVFSNDDDP
jgi:hypothetical protein